MSYDERTTAPNELQHWAHHYLIVFLRWAYMMHAPNGEPRPNYNYEPDVNIAIRVSETIVSNPLYPFHSQPFFRSEHEANM
jgi:hypothetical protein